VPAETTSQGPADPAARSGVIHDLGYRRYDGPRLGRAQIGRALAWHSLRGAFLADGGRFDMGWWRAVARQVRGPIAAGSLGTPAAARLPVRKTAAAATVRTVTAAGSTSTSGQDDVEQSVPLRVNAAGNTFGPE